MIKYICETVGSNRDKNGNCYYYCLVTPTDTNLKTVMFIADGPTNARGIMVNMLGLQHGEYYDILKSIGKRDWTRKANQCTLYEYELTPEHFNQVRKKSLVKEVILSDGTIVKTTQGTPP